MITKSVSVISATLISVAVLVGVILTSALRTPHEQAPNRNGPGTAGPGVVRVSVVEGSAVVQRGDSHVQTNAVRNAPMLPGDYISTGTTSHAELQFDGYTAVRLGGTAQARIVSNDPNNRKVQLADGTAEIGLMGGGEAIQVDTPSVSVRAQQAGDVRISIAADGSSWITARRGGADVVTPQQTYTLGTGRTLSARGSASNPAITYGPEVAFDSFDDLNAERDKTMLAALSANPSLNPRLAGYENLNDYGRWEAVAGYGQSWVPNEPAGWVPYRNGSWTWEGGYGWTWVGSEPWGWTPYHYGNWYYCDCGSSGWAWLPPASKAAQTWSPALVGFFGFDVASTGGPNNCGGNYGYAPSSSGAPAPSYGNEAAAPSNNAAPAAAEAPYNSAAPGPYGEGGPSPETPYGVGGPAYPAANGYPYPYIGWVPIAPYEPFYPWYPGWAWLGFGWGYGYPASFATNIVNVTNITRIYRNFRHGGATGTTTRHFRHGTVHGHTVAVTPRDLGRRVGTIHGTLPIKPTRNNLAFSHGTVHAPVTFSKAFNSPRFALHGMAAAHTSVAQHRAVTPATRAGFTGHAAARAALGRANAPVSHATVPTTRTNAAIAHASMPERSNAVQSRGNVPVTHQHPTFARENAAPAHQIEATRRGNAPVTRENSAPAMRENTAPAMREGSEASRQPEPARSEFAPSTSWDRFNVTRGEARSAGEVSAPNEAGREERAPSDSWGRFSASRGESYRSTRGESYGSTRGESYGGSRDPYAGRESVPSYGRETPSYSRGSYPSYPRESYPSYSHGSYPSYSHGSYPSYPRGSYSAPSYSRGSYGSAPSYSRGNWSPPRSSGGGGGGAPHGGGGRPPH